MSAFLYAAAACVLALVALGLLRLLRGPTAADRMMAGQLAGTGLSAACLLLASATDAGALVDVAVALALLSTLAVAALGLRPSARNGRSAP